MPGAGARRVPARWPNLDARRSGALAGSLGLARPALIGGVTQERSRRSRACLVAHAADVFTYFIDGALWLPLSAHAYYALEDYKGLAEFVASVLHGVAQE